MVGPDGPVAGATVVATSPEKDDALSARPCGCGDCQMKLIECGCEHAIDKLVELVAQREGEAQPMARTRSGADGTFVLEGLEANHYTLWADASRIGSAVLPDVAGGATDATLEIAPGVDIAGKALDEDGKPVSGARVTAILVEHARLFESSSGPDGSFTFHKLPAGQYALIGMADGLLAGFAKLEDGEPAVITLQAPHPLAGLVRADGAPAPGIAVTLKSPHRTLDATSDALGRFSFSELRKGKYELSATDGNRIARATVQVPREGDELVLDLQAGGSLQVFVSDDADAPIGDAEVTLGPTSAKTDAAGAVHLGPVAPGEYRVHATAKHHAAGKDAQVTLGTGEGSPVKLVLPRAALLSGQVVSADGTPVEHAQIRAVAAGDDEAGASSGWATSEADGGFVVDGLTAGKVKLKVSADDYTPAELEAEAPSSDVRIVLQSGLTVDGHVLDEREAPVANAAVVIFQNPGEMGRPTGETPLYRDAHTDANGKFHLGGLRAGKFMVMFADADKKPDVLSGRRGTRSIDLQGSLDDLVLRFAAGVGLTGQVQDVQGAPIADASVMAMPDRSQKSDEMRLPSRAKSGADGHFAFAHLEAGNYRFMVFKAGYVSPTDPPLVSTDGAPVVITLRPAASVHGRVVHEDGTPFTQFTVDGRPTSDPGGKFAAYRQSDGVLKTVLAADGEAPVTVKTDVKLGDSHDVGDVVLGAGRRISGTVVDSAGAPVAEAVIAPPGPGFATYDDRSYSSTGTRSVSSDSSGHFVIEHASADAITLTVEAAGFAPAHAQVPVEKNEVQVQLQRGARLVGHVSDASGKPLRGGLQVEVSGELRNGSVDANGDFEVDGLPAGDAVVNLMVRGAAANNAGFGPKSAHLATGQTTRLDFQASSGYALHVTLAASSQNALVSLITGAVAAPTSPADLRQMWLRSQGGGSGGAFDFQGLADGAYTIVVYAPGSQMGRFRVAVHPVQVAGQDVSMAVDTSGLGPELEMPGWQ